MMIQTQQRLEMRHPPSTASIMYQEWRNLLFLHWKWDKDKIQEKLPEGLFVDTFEDNAYITILPFFIQNLRIAKLPPIPFLSDFIEVNVRTYVYDRNGIPGICFFSLDINSSMVTFFARQLFFLPYQKAKFISLITEKEISIFGQRNNKAMMNFNFSSKLETQKLIAKPDTLTFFLLERYVLFSFNKNQLYLEKIHHSPYLISEVHLKEYKNNLLEINNLQPFNQDPDSIHFCEGLNVDFFPLKKLLSNIQR